MQKPAQHLLVKPGASLAGEVTVPGDKSITHRALIFSALGSGRSEIRTPLHSGDIQSTIGVLRKLGVTIEQTNAEVWQVESPGLFGFSEPTSPLDCGNSGTTTRLMLGILAAQNFPSEIIGDSSLSRRPMDRVLTPLKRMGARFAFTPASASDDKAFLPLKVLASPQAGLRGIHYESPISSAQVKSALLLAGLYAQGVTTVIEPTLSRDHTERLLASIVPLQYGLMSFETPTLQGGTQVQKKYRVQLKGPIRHLPAASYGVPGDFSSAAFFIVASVIAARKGVCMRNVGINPTRTGLLDILQGMGAQVRLENQRETAGEPTADLVVGLGEISAFNVSGETTTRAIDEIPIWCVAAGLAKCVSILSDASELKVKETDRLAAMAENLKRLGVHIERTEDGLVIRGREDGLFQHPQDSGYGPGYLESFDDHRIAMAMVIASLRVAGHKPVSIRQTDCIGISYPNFLDHVKSLLTDAAGTVTIC